MSQLVPVGRLGLLLLLAACAFGPRPVGDFPGLDTRTATLASLGVGERTGSGDYLLSTHPANLAALVVNEELRIRPDGPILELVLHVEVRVTERGGAAPVGFEVIRPDMSDKVLLRFEPPGGAAQRTFVLDGTGAPELVVRPSAESRDLVVILGRSRVTWRVE